MQSSYKTWKNLVVFAIGAIAMSVLLVYLGTTFVSLVGMGLHGSEGSYYISSFSKIDGGRRIDRLDTSIAYGDGLTCETIAYPFASRKLDLFVGKSDVFYIDTDEKSCFLKQALPYQLIWQGLISFVVLAIIVLCIQNLRLVITKDLRKKNAKRHTST